MDFPMVANAEQGILSEIIIDKHPIENHPRKIEILKLKNKGRSNTQVANDLGVSSSTVRSALYHQIERDGQTGALELLGAKSSAEAIQKLKIMGLL